MSGVSSIYRHGPAPDLTAAEAKERNRKIGSRIWHETGKVFLDPDDIINDFDRQHVINQAERLYGQRGGYGKG